MARVICYSDRDGNVCVVVPAPSARRRGETVAEFLARIAAKDAPPGAIVIDDANLPTDRKFRAAWVIANGAVVHDMAKARTIHLRRIRAKRNALLRATDGLVVKANEVGDTATADQLRALRQRLRDIPADISASIDAAADAAALDAITSAALSEAESVLDSTTIVLASRT